MSALSEWWFSCLSQKPLCNFARCILHRLKLGADERRKRLRVKPATNIGADKEKFMISISYDQLSDLVQVALPNLIREWSVPSTIISRLRGAYSDFLPWKFANFGYYPPESLRSPKPSQNDSSPQPPRTATCTPGQNSQRAVTNYRKRIL